MQAHKKEPRNKQRKRKINKVQTKYPDKMSGKHCHHREIGDNPSRERTWHFVFITVLPSLEITQISLDILTDEPGNKGTELLTC